MNTAEMALANRNSRPQASQRTRVKLLVICFIYAFYFCRIEGMKKLLPRISAMAEESHTKKRSQETGLNLEHSKARKNAGFAPPPPPYA